MGNKVTSNFSVFDKFINECSLRKLYNLTLIDFKDKVLSILKTFEDDPDCYKKYKKHIENNQILDKANTGKDEKAEEESDGNQEDDKEEDMIKSKKFLLIVSKLITYNVPPEENGIYSNILKIYMFLSKLVLIQSMIKIF
jgi:hypothetical protein